MKYFVVFIFLSLSISQIHAQNNDYYMEILPTYRIKFRTHPTASFQSLGFKGENIKPYMMENPVSQRAFEQFQVNRLISNGFIGLSYISLGVMVYDFSTGNFQKLFRGSILAVGSTLIGSLFTQAAYLHLYRAVDNFNVDRSPVSAFLPSIEPSQHSLGLGLTWDLN